MCLRERGLSRNGVNPYAQYQRTQVETADQKKLLLMLYEGALRFLGRARRALPQKDSEAANNYLRARKLSLNLWLINLEVGISLLPFSASTVYALSFGPGQYKQTRSHWTRWRRCCASCNRFGAAPSAGQPSSRGEGKGIRGSLPDQEKAPAQLGGREQLAAPLMAMTGCVREKR